MLTISASTPYVKHALLALAATHIAKITKCMQVVQLALEHRQRAMAGLREAIDSFSPKTSDTILAASLLLSWQVTDACVVTSWKT